MKAPEMAQKTDKELETIITTTREKLAELRVDFRTKKVSDIKEINRLKKDLARALTLQRERQIAEMEKANG
jgi:large subunit ribosomal protein L29